MLLEGLRLNRYFLVHLIEKGGMGEIYLAEDSNLGRSVAIKLIRTEITADIDSEAMDEAVRLFQGEAKAITMLDHPHILPLFDYGEESLYGIRYTYMVMPYRQEGSLASWIRRNRKSGPLPLPEVMHFLQQAVDALQYAHDHGIIHRDVKPSNFLIFGGKKYPNIPDLQLADFGVAKFMRAMPTTSTTIRGTPMYMAPEMWRGEAVAASDQYALAVMVYELLAGHPPFQGSTHHQLLYQHMHVQPQPLSTFNECVPLELDIVLMRALLKTPEDRYASISMFGRAFEHAIINGRNTHIILPINSAEARHGTMQVVTLPGGRRVTVVVPRGAHDGQVLRFEGLGERCKFDGPLGALIVTISITRAVESVSLTNTDALDRTVPAASPSNDDYEEPNDPHQNRSKIPFLLLILSVILAIAISGGLLAYSFFSKTSNTPQQTVTNSTHQSIVTPNATATAANQANQTATASATSFDATATAASAQSTATAVSEGATATAISAQVTATAVAQEATATAYSNIMNAGVPALIDPLKDNSQNFNWDTTSLVGGGGCAFTNGAYHSSMPQKGPFSLCFAQATHFTNFTYQVQMKIIQGTQGGVIFRADNTNGTFYYFHINRNGTYGLDIYSGNVPSKTLSQGPTAAILTAPGQTNLIGVVANAGKIDLYVNMQYVTSVSDSTYTSGQIGVVADAIDAPTEVVFSNAQVNRLP